MTGGYVIAGKKIPALRGTYLYADYCSSKFWSFSYSAGKANGLAEITTTSPRATIRGRCRRSGKTRWASCTSPISDGKVWRIDGE